MHLLALTGTTERFTVILVFLTAVLGLISALGGVFWKAGRALLRQIEAIDRNTVAIHKLTGRVESLERSSGSPATLPLSHLRP
jgi:hypothetical protein